MGVGDMTARVVKAVKSVFTPSADIPVATMKQPQTIIGADEKKLTREIVSQLLKNKANFPDILALFREDLNDFGRLACVARNKKPEFERVSVESLEKDHDGFVSFLYAIGSEERSQLTQRFINTSLGVLREPPLGLELGFPEKLLKYSFTLHKTDYSADTNEDASSGPSLVSLEDLRSPATFAVSDGATSSPDSRRWAQMLVQQSQNFGSERAKFLEALPSLKSKWKEDWEKTKSQQLTAATGWWAEQALEKPNAATFCSITFATGSPQGAGELHWKAIAIGDSCLFHFQAGKLLASFPIDDVVGFTDRPTLVRSSADASDFGLNDAAIAEKHGTARRSDTFVLATDAVAEWILGHVVGNDEYTRKILLPSQDFDFERLVLEEREAGRMKDDDSTLVVIGVR